MNLFCTAADVTSPGVADVRLLVRPLFLSVACLAAKPADAKQPSAAASAAVLRRATADPWPSPWSPPPPPPALEQVLVKTVSIGVNPVDLLVRSGHYKPASFPKVGAPSQAGPACLPPVLVGQARRRVGAAVGTMLRPPWLVQVVGANCLGTFGICLLLTCQPCGGGAGTMLKLSLTLPLADPWRRRGGPRGGGR